MVIVRCLKDGDDLYSTGDWISVEKKDTSEWVSGKLGYIGNIKIGIITTGWHKDHQNDLIHCHSVEIRSDDVEQVVKINQLFETDYDKACIKLAFQNISEKNL